MATYFVTRHQGAREWAKANGIEVDFVVDHLDVQSIQPGDIVIGSLPVNLAFKVCERSGRYFHLSLEIPKEWRGKELTKEQMDAFGGKIEEYRVYKV